MSGWHEVRPGDFELHPALKGVAPDGWGAISEPEETDGHVTQYVMPEGASFVFFDGGELELGLRPDPGGGRRWFRWLRHRR